MDTNGYYQNGRITSNGGSIRNGSGVIVPRIMTVDEALPYSPFSSIVPFNSEIIPVPKVGLLSSPSVFSTSEERDRARGGLEGLNREAQQPYNTSQRLERSLNELKELLKPEGLTHFRFKTSPSTAQTTSQPAKINLSPFAQLLYDNTSVQFTYPYSNTSANISNNSNKTAIQPIPKSRTPSTPKANSSHQESSQSTNIRSAESTITPRPTSTRPTSTKPSSTFAVVIPGLPNNFPRNDYTPAEVVDDPMEMSTQIQTHLQTPTHKNQAKPAQIRLEPPKVNSTPIQSSPNPNTDLAVIIPDLPSTFRAGDYDILPDSPDTPQHLSKKRKRSDTDEEDGISRSIDQREKSESAFRHLRDCMADIFEAEDQIQPDNFIPNQFFTAASEGYSLTNTAHAKVEPLLQKVLSVGRFAQAPLDDLLRLQKMCDITIKDAENVDVKLDESMGESDFENWLQEISKIEHGIRAARTSLLLMTGNREEKQLYSEDTIQSALNALKNVIDNTLIPVVEMRNSGAAAALFRLLSAEKKTIINLLGQCRRLSTLMATLINKIELSENVINTLEFIASRLIFVENAHSEKDSVLGVSKFDSLRVVAMDILAQIFSSNPAQRAGIFEEILTSLAKLPVTKQSARQFKLPEGGSIQLVSALLMRLIQTSASKADDSKAKRRTKALEALNGDAEEIETEFVQPAAQKLTITSENKAEQQYVTAIQELRESVSPLLDTAKQNTFYVVNFIVTRAMTSTKTGDSPYRNLLDLFVEDFITCLGSIDWPAAELLLRIFLVKMVHLAEDKKTSAPAKNMALDLLALMGAAISELNSNVRKTASALESEDGELGKYLARLANASLDRRASQLDVISWSCGPFRVCLEFLETNISTNGAPQLRSAIGFLLAEWALKLCTNFDTIDDDDEDNGELEKEYGKLAYRLRMMISDSSWLSTEYSFDTVSSTHARLAYSVALLNSPFCESFSRVLTILLNSMTSEQATVRSKSLKAVNQVLDTDPTIIDKEPAVKALILKCSVDSSVQVRDSALSLIGKLITFRPALEEEMIPNILQRVNDSGVGVRKRVIKLLKDIYLRNSNRDVRSVIADSLLHRVNDSDEGVQELARQTIEEIWMSPFYQSTSSENTSPQFKLAMADHVALMVTTVQRSSTVAAVLDKVLQSMLSSNAKYTAANFKVCKALVATMFDTIIDNPAGDGDDAPSARDALQILTIFAKSNPKLFTAEQVQLLQPYIANVGTGDDLAIYRSVVVIFRHVLPDLSQAHQNFLIEVRKDLIPAVSKTNKTILDDLIACLWIIASVLDDFRVLTRLVLSSLGGVYNTKPNAELDEASTRKVTRLLLITGMCGKHFDLDPQYEIFAKTFPSMKDRSVSRLMTDTFAPFASPEQPLEVRKAALEAIGMVCQSWPKNFMAANIYTTFKEVFEGQDPVLEMIVIKAFKDFMFLEEKRSEARNEDLPGAAADSKATLGVMGGGQGDGVALSISQQFLRYIIRIALSRQDEEGLLATELVASVARQGLVHPKETGSTLIALETSMNPKISEIAFREHRALHEKHETILEKEYMRAVQLAYEYQRDVVGSTHGANVNPFTSKLAMMIEVMKISKPKSRKRFYDNLCARMEFDPLKMDLADLPHHLEFSQFIIENMAFFEYATIDELLSAISAMERVVAATGTGVAHSIETEIFQIKLDQPSQMDENGLMQPTQVPVDADRLKQLTAASMMLSSLWEARSYLRRQYGLLTNKKESKNKSATKDLNRAPLRVQGVNGDKFWEETSSTMSCLVSDEAMMAQCRSFVELLTIDQDFKVAAEGDEEAEKGRLSTPDSDNEETSNGGTPGPPGSGRGRKRKNGPSGTPGGRKAKRSRSTSAPPRGRGRAKLSGKKAAAGRSDDEGDIY